MLHFQARRLISAYVDQALDSQNAVKVRAHVEGCAKCRRTLEEIQSGSRLAKLARHPTSIDDLTLARILGSLGRSSGEVRRARPVAWSIGLAVALLFGVLIAWWHPARSFRGITTQVLGCQRGSLPVEWVVWEAANLGGGLQNDGTRYALTVASFQELTQQTGQNLPEPDLPPGFSFRRGFVYREKYGGAVGRLYAAPDGRLVCLLDQSAKVRVAYGVNRPERGLFCGKTCTNVRWPSLRLLTWESGKRRTLVLTNMSPDQLEPAFLHYPGLH